MLKEDEPLIHVGILHASRIQIRLLNAYTLDHRTLPEGRYWVESDGKGHYRLDGAWYETLDLKHMGTDLGRFEVSDVVIGVDFHWQRKEVQQFEGNIHFVTEQGKIWLVNAVPLERYLYSVIASEMRSEASPTLLKAHAVISRSWLLYQQAQKKAQKQKRLQMLLDRADERIKWYDREDHLLFDVCADDHCQRYQGITRIANPQVAEAIRQTRGEVLTYDNNICDARFSKCCGGWMEVFSSCWDDSDRPYLQSKPDRISTNERLPIPDLRNESEAQRWILSRPEAFCNTEDADILSQVLNNYDQETTDFYRWHQFYTTEQLSILFAKRSGVDVGSIHELIPLERGTSGRIKRLRVVGSKRTFTLGKELEIRKALSESHLYSSAFIVEKTAEGFHLRGAGWGHGAGLCQIGAAVMSVNGHSYQDILNHYYPNTQLKKIYP